MGYEGYDFSRDPEPHPVTCPACDQIIECHREWLVHVERENPANVYTAEQLPDAGAVSRADTLDSIRAKLPVGIFADEDEEPSDRQVSKYGSISSLLPDRIYEVGDMHDYNCSKDAGYDCPVHGDGQ